MDLFQAMTVYVRSGGSRQHDRRRFSVRYVHDHGRQSPAGAGATAGRALAQPYDTPPAVDGIWHAYYQRCLEVLGLVADSERLAEQALDQPSGTLRITAPLTFGTEKLAPALSEFALLCPRVKLDVVLTNRRPDLLENGFDVAFRLGNTEETNLIARPLLDYTLTMCASPEYLARKGTPEKPEDLQHHDCLSFAYPAGDDWQSVEKHWRLTGPDGEVAVAVNGPMLINSSAGLHQAARTGMGIVMLPDALMEQDLKDGKLVALMPDYLPPSRPMNLMYAQDRYRLPKLRSFVDFTLQRWGKH